MDITYTTEFDAGRYAKTIGRALAFSYKSAAIFYWCFLAPMVLFVFSTWLGGWSEEYAFILFGLFFAIILQPLRYRAIVRAYVRQMRQMLGGGEPITCRVTDSGCETTCGELVQKMPWRKLASHYHFLDDDTVAFMLKSAAPVMVLSELRKHGIDRAELEAALRKVGLESAGASRKRRIQLFASVLIGVVFVACGVVCARSEIGSYRNGLYCHDTRIRLFDLIHGADDPERPLPIETTRAQVVRLLSDVRSPDEFVYVFVPDEEHDKVGLFARYGDWSCEAYYPCGCACAQTPGYFAHIKELHKPTVYLESEKEKWLEKVRSIANELYEEE